MNIKIYKKLAFLFISLFATSACTAMDGTSKNVALIKAQVLSVEDAPDSPPRDIGRDHVEIGGNVKATMTVYRTLIGYVGQKKLVMIMRTAAWPITPFDAFLLVEKQPDQETHVLWWDRAEHGLCMHQEMGEKYGIEKAVADLRGEYPCKLKYFAAVPILSQNIN